MQYIKNTLLRDLEQVFSAAIAKLEIASEYTSAEITESTQPHFGHYQCNNALKLVKIAKKSPKAIAESIVSYIADTPLIDKIEIAPNGFINIWIHPKFLAQKIESMLINKNFNIQTCTRQRIIIDFSSPNTAKEMHVGHLRSTIIGDCLARIFEFLNQDVLRLNHIGDWGTSFGMLIAYMKQQHVDASTQCTLTELVTLYRQAKKQFDEDESFKKAAQAEVVALQSGEQQARDYWKNICTISSKAYQEIYHLLDIQLIERGESFYNPMLETIVHDLQTRGIATLCSGAICIFLDGFRNKEGSDLPLIIQKSDGGYNYDTTDMAAILHRVQEEKAGRIIYVTDAGQATHFKMIFQAAEKAHYVDPQRVQLDHVPFGLVLGADGKKFRTRAGETEKLIDLLNAAIEKAREMLLTRNPQITPKELDTAARVLGLGAIKYADLCCNRISDYTFSYDRMLRFEGNTAAFILYSYVRIQSIKRKTNVDINELQKTATIELLHPSEMALALKLARFPEVLEKITQDLMPHRLTEYLFEVAETFNAFFRDCRVEGSTEQNSRLLLIEAAGRIVHTGLTLLGIKTLERM